jgi:hypothetical protein
MTAQVGFFAVAQLEAAQKRRIFTQGLKVDGSKIGSYKAYTAYFGAKDYNAPSYFVPNTKGGKSFKTNKGWAGLREAEGFQTQNVDLQHKQDLKDSIQTIYNGGTIWSLVCASPIQQKKIDAAEKRYGAIFYAMTASDERQLQIDIEDKIQDIINGIL